MTQPIHQLLDSLPSSGLTVRLLHALDAIVPGEYQNLVGFENTVRVVSGVSDPAEVRRIGERAVELFNDPDRGYQRAVWLYQTVDTLQCVSGYTALAGKIGEDAGLSYLLPRMMPKADTIQAVDFALKLSAEVVAYCNLHGLPVLQMTELGKVLDQYQNEALMRMGALICCDGLVPLGPDFVEITLGMLQKVGPNGLEANSRFQSLRAFLPGFSADDQFGFIFEHLKQAGGWMTGFINARNLETGRLGDRIKSALLGLDGKLDYLGAALDIAINYYEHTGVQTVARRLVQQATADVV